MSNKNNKAMSTTSVDLLCLIAVIIAASSIQHSVQAAFITPILKDQKTLQYTTTIELQTPLRPTKLVIDLGAQFSWVNCQSGYNSTTYAHTACNSTLCTALNSFACSNCYTPPAPDCGNFTCALFPENPISNNASIDDAIIDRLSVPTTPSNRQTLISHFVFSCSKTYMLTDLAQNATGMLALGRANFSFPPQLARFASLPNIFSLCLSPSTTLPGFGLFASAAPNSILDGNNLSKTLTLTYTPLILNPFSDTIITYALHPSFNYFINLTSISINGHNLPLNQSLLSIDPNTGLGGTKISTLEPYIVIQPPSIYNTFVSAFESAASAMNLTSASPIKPFKVCYYANSTSVTESGSPLVPIIELGLGNGVKWSVDGANVVVSVKKGKKSRRLCLGVVEKGVVVTERAAVVVGGLLVEDNVVEFDLVRLRFGFSGNLGAEGTSCAAAAASGGDGV